METEPAKPSKMPAWAIAILKYLVTFLLGGGAITGSYYAANRPVEPVPTEITLAEEFNGATGELIELSATTAGTRVRWRSLDPGMHLIDDLPDLVTRKECRAIACAPGKYRVECWSAIGSEPTHIYRTTVVVGKPGPQPTPPVPVPPNPSPTPPTPIPPAPTSELGKKLQACWDADATNIVVKTSQRALIIGLYEAMTDHAKNAKVTTTGELLADLQELGKTMLLPGALVECRKVISVEVAAALGVEPVLAMDTIARAKAVAVFAKVAKAMGEVR